MITFNSKTEKEIDGLIVISRSISTPSKKKIKVDVPFMHGSYDFSTVGSNGEIVYTQREISITFGIKAISKEHLQVKYTQLINWLVDIGKSKLVFDDMLDLYFLAEVEDNTSLEEVYKYGTVEVKFIAEPFKYGVNLEGSDIWDNFNFETDYVQDTEFDIVGSKAIQIYNPGRSVSPKINCTSSMTVINDGYTANFIAGDNQNWNFKLKPGLNNITVNGTGHIKFIFRKEML